MVKKRRNIYMDEERYKRADEKAEELGLSFNALVTVALNEYLKQENVVDMVAIIKELKKAENNVKKQIG